MLDRRLVESAAHLLVDDIDAPEVHDGDQHHLFRVLRLRDGEFVTVTDGRGQWRAGVVVGTSIESTEPVVKVERPQPELTVGFALTKADRPEWVVQKLAELGVDRIVPFVAARSIVKWDETKAQRNVDRWRTVVREAVMQSRGVFLPEVASVGPFAPWATKLRSTAARGDMRGKSLAVECSAIFIGPEGGWTEEEAALLPSVGLGEQVFRAETAAIVAGAYLVGARFRG